MSGFSKRLKELRNKKGLRQEDIADLFYTGKSTVSQWEKGVHTPNIETITKLADFFNVDINYMLGYEAKSNSEETNSGNGKPDLEAPLREKNRADALLKISEIDSMFDVPDEVILDMIRQVRKKFGPLPQVGEPAAHGPLYPGSDALKELKELKKTKGRGREKIIRVMV